MADMAAAIPWPGRGAGGEFCSRKFSVFSFLFSVKQALRLLCSQKLSVGRKLPPQTRLPLFMRYGRAKGS
jgi:hypothetical protein